MEDFIFFEGTAPSGYKFDYEVSLFNLPEHRLLQSPVNWISFYILQEKKKIIEGGIHFQISDNIASSPYRSPFGSVEASGKIDPHVLYRFLQFVETTLKEKGVRNIVIKNPPSAYHPYLQNLLQTFFINLGYKITNAEVGSILHVNKPFDDLSDEWEKRKVKQAYDKDLVMKTLSVDEISPLYNFILECRQRKGYLSSMTLEQIKTTANKFPGRFILTGVYQHEKMVAASISIEVNEKVLYHFYSDHETSDKSINPTIFLIKGLYEYALEHKIEMFDLGTSALNGTPNFGLLNFKLRLGATTTTKFTFEKTL